jgi:hypothetical protein
MGQESSRYVGEGQHTVDQSGPLDYCKDNPITHQIDSIDPFNSIPRTPKQASAQRYSTPDPDLVTMTQSDPDMDRGHSPLSDKSTYKLKRSKKAKKHQHRHEIIPNEPDSPLEKRKVKKSKKKKKHQLSPDEPTESSNSNEKKQKQKKKKKRKRSSSSSSISDEDVQQYDKQDTFNRPHLWLPTDKSQFSTFIDYGCQLDEQNYPIYPNGDTVFVLQPQDKGKVTNFGHVAWTHTMKTDKSHKEWKIQRFTCLGVMKCSNPGCEFAGPPPTGYKMIEKIINE